MKTLAVILLIVTLNNAALFMHYNYANKIYEDCYFSNFAGDENAIKNCMKNNKTFRIFGTILFTEGSYLEEIL